VVYLPVINVRAPTDNTGPIKRKNASEVRRKHRTTTNISCFIRANIVRGCYCGCRKI